MQSAAVQIKTWSEAEQFCRSNGSRTLPVLVDKAAMELFEMVLLQLPAQMHLCTAWLALHTTYLTAATHWRWLDGSTLGN